MKKIPMILLVLLALGPAALAEETVFQTEWTKGFPDGWDVWSEVVADSELTGARPPDDAPFGERFAVNARWFGFDPQDATAALQGAIDSGARLVYVPNMGQPWIVTPIRLRGNLTLVLDRGVEIQAKRGEFRGRNHSLLSARDVENLIILGFGAVLRMHKTDYMEPPYERAEWRMGISLRSVARVQVEGLEILSTGGDAIYVGTAGESDLPGCRDVLIRDCIFRDNHRQGISVISAENLLIERCFFLDTWGTGPSAGLDFEPNRANEMLVNQVVRHSVFSGNHGAGILVYLRHLNEESRPVSILVEDCHVQSGKSFGISLGGAGGRDQPGPEGLFLVRNTVVENTVRAGAYIYHKDRRGVRVRFENCVFRNTARGQEGEEFARPGPAVGIAAPLIVFKGAQGWTTRDFGGIDFDRVLVFDDRDRPYLLVASDDPEARVADVRHDVRWANPHATGGGVRMRVEGASLDALDSVEPHQ